jgi:hypothetical protein
MVVLIAASLLAIMALFVAGGVLKSYILAALVGVPVSIFDIIGMRLRRSDVDAILFGLIRMQKSGVPAGLRDLEMLHLAGGDVGAAASAMIGAKLAGIEVSWDEVAAAELAGADVVEVTRAIGMARDAGLELLWTEAALLATEPGGVLGSVLARLKAEGRVDASVTVQEWVRAAGAVQPVRG